MIQKAAAMGTWWLAASSWQRARSCITSCAEFFGKTSNHPGDSASWEPRFGAEWLLAKTKITFEREEISDCWWDSGKYDRAADGDWENCVRSQGSYFEGDWGIIFLCTMFLVSFSINVSIFHITWLDTSWTDLVYSFGKLYVYTHPHTYTHTQSVHTVKKMRTIHLVERIHVSAFRILSDCWCIKVLIR